MEVIVMGAGVIGTATAWFLNRAGHEVTVLERNAGAACETSFGNGGQISVSHAEPWANPSAPFKLLKWLGREDAPLLFRLRADPDQWRWGLKFLAECPAKRSRRNMIQVLNLGTYSRATLQQLRSDIGIEYDHLTKGILHFYTSAKEFDAALEPARIMRDLGCERQVVDANEVLRLEPAMASTRPQLAGAIYTRADESGDVHKFTTGLAERAAKRACGSAMEYASSVCARRAAQWLVSRSPARPACTKSSRAMPTCSRSAVSARSSPGLPA